MNDNLGLPPLFFALVILLVLVIDSLDFTKSTAFESKDERTRRLCQKTGTPSGFRRAGFINSGDVLLSRNLEMHYHWGCSVSLPCSEWERVVPLRYYHQRADAAELQIEDFKLQISPRSNLQRCIRISGDCRLPLIFQRTQRSIFNLKFEICNYLLIL